MTRVTSLFLSLGLGLGLLSFTATSVDAAGAAGVVSCDCEQSACGPCEIEVGTSFYTAKCGPGNSRVKSCKKTTCEAVEDQKQCLAELAAKLPEKKVAVPSGANPAEATAQAAPVKTSARQPASDSDAVSEKASGEITVLQGVARITRTKTKKSESARKGLRVYQGDLIETEADTKLKVQLYDSTDSLTSSALVILPKSRVRIDEAAFQPEKNTRAVLLNLLSGRVRSQVKQKYEKFHVKTKSAVAGVRGTDFVTTFDPSEAGWRTEIRTLEGTVRLASAATANGDETEQASDEIRLVGKGEYAAFVVENVSVSAEDASEEQLQAALAKGFMTPTIKMSDEEAALYEAATNVQELSSKLEKNAARNVASAPAQSANDAASVCSSPRGDFNQCSWTCEGNPAGEKRCRTDLPGVACVRRLCRANGQWAEATRLPASQTESCSPDKAIVRSCGSYW